MSFVAFLLKWSVSIMTIYIYKKKFRLTWDFSQLDVFKQLYWWTNNFGPSISLLKQGQVLIWLSLRTTASVTEVFPHADYNVEKHPNDIALLKLSTLALLTFVIFLSFMSCVTVVRGSSYCIYQVLKLTWTLSRQSAFQKRVLNKRVAPCTRCAVSRSSSESSRNGYLTRPTGWGETSDGFAADILQEAKVN